MKILVFISFSVIPYFCVHSQGKGYVNYFHETNKAALNILKSDYDAALTVYKTVFKSYPHSFYRDIHNACVCAIKLNKVDEAFEFARMMVLHGYELSDFDKEPFVYLKNNKKQWRKFTNAYPKYRDKYIETVDWELREKYYALYLKDQLAAEHDVNKTIKKQDSAFYNLSVQLIELVETNGFPDWMVNKDTMSLKLMVMLRHYCGMENRITQDEELQNDVLYSAMNKDKIQHMVENAFSKGLMQPDAYEAITIYFLRKNPYGVIGFNIDYDAEKVTPRLLLTPKEVIEANKRRESIGLLTINQDTEAIINASWYKDFPFKEIKKAVAECNTCETMMDYIYLMSATANVVENEYDNEKYHFILPISYSNEIYAQGRIYQEIDDMVKEKQKK